MVRYRLRVHLQEVELPAGETTIGRSDECHVTIDDPAMSREHAMIVVTSEQVIVRDLGSRNGTRINGQRVVGAIELHNGDRIRLGSQEILFSRVVTPRRTERSTCSVRQCASCRASFIAKAPSCPQCGAVPETTGDHPSAPSEKALPMSGLPSAFRGATDRNL